MDLPAPHPFRFSREQYHRLEEVGFFDPADRLELVDGLLMIMVPVDSEHALAVRNSNWLFNQRLGERCVIDCQNALNLDANSEPQPDFLFLRSEFRSVRRLPEAGDVLLLIEAAASSLGFDRGVKLRLYARNGVPEVWIYNLLERAVEVYREPTGDAYQWRQVFHAGERVAPLAFADVSFAIEELLP